MTQTSTSSQARTRGRRSPSRDREKVQEVLEKAAYLVMFSVPDPQSLSVGTPLVPFFEALIFEISIVEAPRQLQLLPSLPTARCGFRTKKRVDGQIANQSLRLQVSPNYFQCGLGRNPPPTLLLPFLSQRFWMSNGNFEFLDGLGTRFTAEAAGRFFPISGGSVFIGGVGRTLEGFGQLKGFEGNIAINGLTTPPAIFANVFVFRFVDEDGALSSQTLPPVVPEEPDPDDTDSSILAFMGRPKPGTEPEVGPGPNGQKSYRFVEELRLASTNIDVSPGVLKGQVDELAPVVGERRTTLVFDPDSPLEVVPGFSVASEFVFWTGDGVEIGSLQLDLKEARLIPTQSSQLDKPYFRITGFGPFGQGTGQFVDVSGMLTMNGALNVDPWAITSMYVMRIPDALNRFQSPWQGGDP